jgi:hypothetical protein
MLIEDLLYTTSLYSQNNEFRLLCKKWKTYYDQYHFPFNLKKIELVDLRKVYEQYSRGGKYFHDTFPVGFKDSDFLNIYLKEKLFQNFELIEIDNKNAAMEEYVSTRPHPAGILRRFTTGQKFKMKKISFKYYSNMYNAILSHYYTGDAGYNKHIEYIDVIGPGVSLHIEYLRGDCPDEMIIDNYFNKFSVINNTKFNKLPHNILCFIMKILCRSIDMAEYLIVKNAIIRL